MKPVTGRWTDLLALGAMIAIPASVILFWNYHPDVEKHHVNAGIMHLGIGMETHIFVCFQRTKTSSRAILEVKLWYRETMVKCYRVEDDDLEVCYVHPSHAQPQDFILQICENERVITTMPGTEFRCFS